nr:hemagglutinin repeat-containing protein [Erwinia sp. S38]
MDTAKTSHATDYTRNSENYDRTLESRDIGSVVSAGGSLLMQAGRDMNLRAADVTATGDATLLAGNNLNLTSGEESWDQSSSAKWKNTVSCRKPPRKSRVRCTRILLSAVPFPATR